ncbi:hypothetical protein VIGAN_04198000, partial [Vigna angularis var. angularis]
RNSNFVLRHHQNLNLTFSFPQFPLAIHLPLISLFFHLQSFSSTFGSHNILNIYFTIMYIHLLHLHALISPYISYNIWFIHRVIEGILFR